jgi:hypothetical protein
MAGLLCLSSLAAAGCGPAIAEQRIGYSPPRPETCAVTVVNGAMKDPMMWAAASGPYELLGTISLNESGTVDPFSDESLNIVRPRACRMGGDAISLMVSTQSTVGLASGTGTSYAVLRKRQPGGLAGAN